MERDRIQPLCGRAERALAAAELALRDGNLGFAAARAFYGSLFVARAMLASQGRAPRKYRQIIAEYGELFADTGRLDPRFQELLETALDLRRIADYHQHPVLPRDQVEEVVRESRRFFAAVQALLAGAGTDFPPLSGP